MFDPLQAALTLVQEAFASLAHEGARPSDEQLTREVATAQQVINALQAVQSVRLAQFAAREDVRCEDGTIDQRDLPVGHVSEFAATVIGPELGLATRGAEDRVGAAARLASAMPDTLQAMASGGLDWARARAMAVELHDADRGVVAQVEAMVFPHVLGDTVGEARRRCRRALQRVDPQSLVERAKRARDGRCLQRWQSEPGISEWHAALPSERAAQAWAAVDELARRQQREDREHGDRPPTLDQARADALLDLVLGNATVRTTVTFAVPETFGRGVQAPTRKPEPAEVTATGLTAGSGGDGDRVIDVEGVGQLPWSVIGPLTTAFSTQISLMSCDPANGFQTGMATLAYKPSAVLERFIKSRDGTCRFPGCSAPACRTDSDHVIPAPKGPTDRTNLISLCRRHHRTKQRPGWWLSMTPDGVATWVNPLGTVFTTYPVDHLNVRDSQQARAS